VKDGLNYTSVVGLRSCLLAIVIIGWPLILWSNSLQVSLLYIYEANFSKSGIYQAGLLWKLLFEMFLFSIHTPILTDFTYNLSHRQYKSGEPSFISWTFDQNLTYLSTLKVYFLFRALPLLTSLTADNSRKISDITGLKLNFKFYFNVLLLEHPLWLLLTTIGVIVFCGGITL
jgi:hypothetical protein